MWKTKAFVCVFVLALARLGSSEKKVEKGKGIEYSASVLNSSGLMTLDGRPISQFIRPYYYYDDYYDYYYDDYYDYYYSDSYEDYDQEYYDWLWDCKYI